jgi:adenosylmethionine-8-amino-7-oxononanoate aminotransferase
MGMVRPAFLQAAEALIRQDGALLIADEVLTGFGRCGRLFASEVAGLRPDLIALSKGLTGGFLPMGVTLAREALYEGFIDASAERTFFHGHSFPANPLGCAAALGSLDLLEQAPERYRDLEVRHRPHLEALAARADVLRPRLLGSIAAFDLAVANPGYLHPAGQRLQRLALAEGVFLRPLGQVVYLLPPLCIDGTQLEQCYGAITAALDRL